MTTNLDDRLAALRPSPHWPADEREVVLDRVLAAERTPNRGDRSLVSIRPHRRPVGAVVALAGMAAAAAIAVPLALPNGSTGGADRAAAAVVRLHHLAKIAAVSPADRLGPHQYWHVITVGHQRALAGQPEENSRFESWTSVGGYVWVRRHVVSVGPSPDQSEVWLWPPSSRGADPSWPSPAYLRSLPTQPAALEAYLRAHTTGSNSKEEAVFVAVGDMLRAGMAPPALRSAAIEMLARLGHVTLGDVTRDAAGNPVQEFKFVDRNTRPDETQSLIFDTRTAQITGERGYFHGKLLYESTVTTSDVVDAVPAMIRKVAIRQK